MNTDKKKIRDWLLNTNRKSFDQIVSEAILFPLQERILRCRFCEGLRYKEIADVLGLSEIFVKRTMDTIYSKIGRLLN